MRYSHSQIEKKWQNYWLKNNTFATDLNNFKKPKFYILDMFPYPSGNGLHIGHIRGYLATDILTRMKKMQGYNVLRPLGFDSFGLPAEQYAMRTHQPPEKFTLKNINNFSHQLQNLGFAYDYRFPAITSDPNFFHWTQWIFLRLYENGLAHLKEKNINYCPALNTVLANEEIINVNGQMLSERENHPVYLVPKKQWTIPIVKYANELIEGLEKLNWPSAIKNAQIKWIGKTKGFTVVFSIAKINKYTISVFLTNLLELKNATFLALAVNFKNIDNFLTKEKKKELEQLRITFSQKPLFDQKLIKPNPIGMNSGLMAINPLNNKKLPIYFVEYIDLEFSYGSKLGSPNTSHQDWFFAAVNKIKPLIKKNEIQNQLKLLQETKKSKQLEIEKLLKIQQQIKPAVFFHLKDWVFSRQRYWGEPFPIKYKNEKIIPLKDNELPLKLPKFSIDFWNNSSFDGSTPLSRSKEWKNKNYDLNTMPQWAGSSWYFLAYILRQPNGYLSLNSPEAKKLLNHWLPVDFYIGGQEHAVSHLLYARFWNIFLFKKNILNKSEPFLKLRNQGMILSQDGKKMSKSKGNVINPLDFLISHGADALRLHEKFLGPFSDAIKWNETNLDSMRKWLARVYSLFMRDDIYWTKNDANDDDKHFVAQLIKNVSENYNKCFFNVAISQLMSFINRCYKSSQMKKKYGVDFLKLLHPLCPHITEEIFELWKMSKKTLQNSTWPQYKKEDLLFKETNIAIQINGKLKGLLKMPINSSEIEVTAQAKNKFSDFLINFKIVKVIFVKNKIVNFVLKPF